LSHSSEFIGIEAVVAARYLEHHEVTRHWRSPGCAPWWRHRYRAGAAARTAGEAWRSAGAQESRRLATARNLRAGKDAMGRSRFSWTVHEQRRERHSVR